MAAERFVKMIDASFAYFGSLGNFYQDPAGVDAVREVRDQMVRELANLIEEPSSSELAALCRRWRTKRIEPNGPATYPQDLFIEGVCQVIELS